MPVRRNFEVFMTARTLSLGFLAVITVGTILLMMPFSTSSGHWNDPIVMYIGRVGILLLMSAILGDPRPTRIHYLEENL